jgi:hypothetical protein
MWPGQQPPGGDQNPRDENSNPYQQPGYQQPNPYQQPGYQQQGQQQAGDRQPGYPPPSHPYQQPPTPQYPAPAPPGRPPAGGRRTVLIAVLAVVAVVVTAGVTGFLVLKKDDGKSPVAGGDSKPSVSEKSEKPDTVPPVTNPRAGGGDAKPQIAGWKVVTSPTHSTQFDVPPDWEVASSGLSSGFEDDEGKPLVIFSSPAFYKSTWCSQDTDQNGKLEDSGLGAAGTKGGKGAKDTAAGAVNEAGNWVWAAYALHEPKAAVKEKVKVSKAEPYTTASGLAGHVATATATGITKKDKCDTDGKSIAFTFVNDKGDYTSWVLYSNTGVPGEIPDATVKKILSSVRLLKSP